VTPPSAAADARARAPLSGRPLRSPAAPRRVSGPARKRAQPRRQPSLEPRRDPPAWRLAHALGAVSRGRALESVLRGRACIGIVTFALVGIVTLQLGLLQLNSRIGRALQREAYLQREDSALSVENSELASAERVQALAARMGMQLAPENALRFLDASAARGVNARAAAALASAVPGATGATGAAGAGATTETPSPATTAASSTAGASGAGASGAPETASGTGAPGRAGAPASAPTSTAGAAAAAASPAEPSSPGAAGATNSPATSATGAEATPQGAAQAPG